MPKKSTTKKTTKKKGGCGACKTKAGAIKTGGNASPWLAKWHAHLKSVREKNPGKTLKECMQLASKTYKKGKEVKKPAKKPVKSAGAGLEDLLNELM